ncbi:MAG: sensor histidine kinase [Spirochaetia bacterium]
MRKPNKGAVKIALIYSIIGILWILFSGQIGAHIFSYTTDLRTFETVKGWFYVISTAILLYFLISSYMKRVLETKTKLRTLVDEKETLLKEIHHRVKNNLQIMQSLLNLTASEIDDEIAKDKIEACKRRIQSMGIVHEQFYESENYSKINIDYYLKRILNQQIKSISTAETKLPDTHIKAAHSFLSIDTAIPFGIIVSELISNSLTHAFSGVQAPEITMELKRDEEDFVFIYRDNGIGIEIESIPSLTQEGYRGFLIIETLTFQLNGSYSFESTDGFAFTLVFPVNQQLRKAEALLHEKKIEKAQSSH